MAHEKQNAALRLVDDLVADGKAHFTFADAVGYVHRSPAATANLLRRMVDSGLLDRVRRGRYVVRPFGVLGTRAAAEDVALAVAAAFSDVPHRIGYRSALDEHDLVCHPARTIHVASSKRIRGGELSGRPLRVVAEQQAAIGVGACERGGCPIWSARFLMQRRGRILSAAPLCWLRLWWQREPRPSQSGCRTTPGSCVGQLRYVELDRWPMRCSSKG